MKTHLTRRRFLQVTAGAAAGMAAGAPALAGARRGVAIVLDPADPVASSPPARWAAGELQCSLADRGVPAAIYPTAAQAPAAHLRVLAGGMRDGVPEALMLFERDGHVWARGHDARGLT